MPSPRAIFFVAFLTVQTVVPLYQLTAPRPSRFGWQMYAGAKAPGSVTLIHSDSSEETHSIARHFGLYRSDLDVTEHLPAYLCRKYQETKSVRLNFILSTPLEKRCY